MLNTMFMSVPLTVLGILDGFGYSSQTEGNAVIQARTPIMDYLWSNFPSYLLKAAEEEVGLEFGEIGNSEVGHMTIGTGRVIPQSLNRINKAIEDGSFYQNPTLLETLQTAKANNSSLHLLGIISTAGVHGHLFHYLACIRLAAQLGLNKVYLHIILDGRDSGKFDSPLFLREINKTIKETGVGQYASLVGRAYTMDRNKNWEKTAKGYNLFFSQGEMVFPEPDAAIKHFYNQGIDDENIPPTIINQSGAGNIVLKENDVLIFTNFREDRARQITQALVEPNFSKFPQQIAPDKITVATMTAYKKGLPAKVIFPPPVISNTLSDVLSQNNITQIHIAETEKYGHVTYFFNGGREEKIPGEEFFMVQSLTPEEFVAKPQMSADQITQAVMQSIDLGYQFIVFNFANCDMVGHTGNYQATVQAIEFVDTQLKTIVDKIWQANGQFFLTADHGNSEQMINPKTGEIYKKHTIAPVPFILANKSYFSSSETIKIMSNGHIAGLLSDITPTILSSLGLPIPAEMTGASLI